MYRPWQKYFTLFFKIENKDFHWEPFPRKIKILPIQTCCHLFRGKIDGFYVYVKCGVTLRFNHWPQPLKNYLPKKSFWKTSGTPPPLPLCWNYFLIRSGKKITECPEIFRGSLACLTFYIFKTVPTPTLVVCKGRDEVTRVHAPSAGGHVIGPEGVAQTGWPLMALCSGQYGQGWPLSVRHTLSGFQPFLMPRVQAPRIFVGLFEWNWSTASLWMNRPQHGVASLSPRKFDSNRGSWGTAMQCLSPLSPNL